MTHGGIYWCEKSFLSNFCIFLGVLDTMFWSNIFGQIKFGHVYRPLVYKIGFNLSYKTKMGVSFAQVNYQELALKLGFKWSITKEVYSPVFQLQLQNVNINTSSVWLQYTSFVWSGQMFGVPRPTLFFRGQKYLL